MKKITISLFVAFIATFGSYTVSAQNLVNGGDFEDPSIETFTYEGHTCPVYLPGWDLKSGTTIDNLNYDDFNNENLNKWSVRGEMLYEESPEDDNYQHLRIQRYEWMQDAGWIDYFGIQQTIAVEAGKTYTLKFDYRVNPPQDTTTNSGFQEADGFATDTVPAFFIFRIAEFPDSIIPLVAREHQNWDKTDINNNWDKFEMEYTVPNNVESLTLFFAVKSGKIYDWGGNINMWMDIDNVSFGDRSNSSVHEPNAPNIKTYSNKGNIIVTGLETDNVINIYNVSGQLLNSVHTSDKTVEIPMSLKGFYILKIGNQTAKVLVK